MAKRCGAAQRAALLLLALILSNISLAPVHASDRNCPETKLNLLTPEAEEVAEICAGARNAEKFFGACGFTAKRHYDVQVSTLVESISGSRLYGQFQPSRNLVSMVTLGATKELVASISDADPMRAYKGVPARELYQALAAHEIAHAITHQNLTARPSVALYEYIGAVVQIASFPEATRAAYLRQFEGVADTSETTFNDIVALIDPASFGASAYLHFKVTNHGCTFLKRLLTEWDVFPQMSIVRDETRDLNGSLAAIEHGPRPRSPADK